MITIIEDKDDLMITINICDDSNEYDNDGSDDNNGDSIDRDADDDDNDDCVDGHDIMEQNSLKSTFCQCNFRS